jgi:hypothetical protein
VINEYDKGQPVQTLLLEVEEMTVNTLDPRQLEFSLGPGWLRVSKNGQLQQVRPGGWDLLDAVAEWSRRNSNKNRSSTPNANQWLFLLSMCLIAAAVGCYESALRVNTARR